MLPIDYASRAEHSALPDVPAAIAARQAARSHLGDAHDAIVRALVGINQNHDEAAWLAIEAAQVAIDSAAERMLSL